MIAGQQATPRLKSEQFPCEVLKIHSHTYRVFHEAWKIMFFRSIVAPTTWKYMHARWRAGWVDLDHGTLFFLRKQKQPVVYHLVSFDNRSMDKQQTKERPRTTGAVF